MLESAEFSDGALGPRVDFIRSDSAAADAISARLEPIRRLADATLWAALQDASGADEKLAYGAVRWLVGDAVEGFSMDACCDRLGLAPDRVVSSAIRYFPLIRKRMEDYRRLALLSVQPFDRD